MSDLDKVAIFNDEAYSATTELVDENVDLFNEASGGTITLISTQNQGDTTSEAYYKKLSGLVRRRNNKDRSSTVSAIDIEHLLKVSAKVPSGTPPVNIDPDVWEWILRDPVEAAQIIAEQLSGDMFQDILDTGLQAFIAATRGADAAGTKLIQDETIGDDSGILTLRGLNRGARLFGDRASMIKAWVMHSTPSNDLLDNALQNAERLFEFSSVNVLSDNVGRRFVITDADALVNSGSPEGFNTLGLVQGAVALERNSDFFANMETSNGLENIHRTWQAQWTHNAGVKGYKWNTAETQPVNDAKLASEANWIRVATSHKDLAGVMVVSD